MVQNRESRWWTGEEYARRYPIAESDKALDTLFEVFNDNWLKEILDRCVNKKGPSHPLVEHLVARGLHPLVILVELGRDVQEAKLLKNFDHMVKELRDPSKFIAAWLELELAAHCIRTGYSVELYPQIRGKMPDLKLRFDGEDVFVEIKESHPSKIERACLETSTILLPEVTPVLEQGLSIEITLGGLPSEPQVAILREKISKQLAEPKPQALLIGSLRVWVRIEKKDSASFSVVPSQEIAVSELIRLTRSIKHEAKQIPSSESGLIILDAGCLQGYSDREIISAVEKTFLKYKLPNIVEVTIVRSYKFYKLEKETEVIMVPNPNYKGNISIQKLDGILSFSRTRKLIP